MPAMSAASWPLPAPASETLDAARVARSGDSTGAGAASAAGVGPVAVGPVVGAPDAGGTETGRVAGGLVDSSASAASASCTACVADATATWACTRSAGVLASAKTSRAASSRVCAVTTAIDRDRCSGAADGLLIGTGDTGRAGTGDTGRIGRGETGRADGGSLVRAGTGTGATGTGIGNEGDGAVGAVTLGAGATGVAGARLGTAVGTAGAAGGEDGGVRRTGAEGEGEGRCGPTSFFGPLGLVLAASAAHRPTHTSAACAEPWGRSTPAPTRPVMSRPPTRGRRAANRIMRVGLPFSQVLQPAGTTPVGSQASDRDERSRRCGLPRLDLNQKPCDSQVHEIAVDAVIHTGLDAAFRDNVNRHVQQGLQLSDDTTQGKQAATRGDAHEQVQVRVVGVLAAGDAAKEPQLGHAMPS